MEVAHAPPGSDSHSGSLLIEPISMPVHADLLRHRLLDEDSELSSALESCVRLGLSTQALGARQVFLDNDKSHEAIAARLDEAVERSMHAPTLAIGPPSVELLTVLRERLPPLEAQKIGIYSASRILRNNRARALNPSRGVAARSSTRDQAFSTV